MTIPIPKKMTDIKQLLHERTTLGRSFDVIFREFTVAERKAALFFCTGFAKDIILTAVMERLSYVQRDQLSPQLFEKLLLRYIPSIQLTVVDDLQLAIENMLTGMAILFIEQEGRAFALDTRQYPGRTPEEPANEKVVRGARDGFVETLLMNVTLVRRRLRDPKLAFEVFQIGERTAVDVAIGAVDGLADEPLRAEIRMKIKQLTDSELPLTDKQLEERLTKGGWSLYPDVRYTERPDVVCAHLLEGHIVLFVDTSPSAMILPVSYFHHLQHAEEYRNTPVVGTYLRWVRYTGMFAAILILPIWLLFALHPELLPKELAFIGPKEEGKLPLLFQFLLAEVGIDWMRMAAIHTPTPLATAMGLIAAILIGQIAIDVGLFIPEVILYVSVAAIGTFATPSYEMSLAHRIIRLSLLISVACFNIAGLMVATTFILFAIARHQSFRTPYLFPLIPFEWRQLSTLVFRFPYTRRR